MESQTGQLRLYNEIVDNISEGVFLVSPTSNIILYANPAVEHIFGYRPGELNGKPISLIHDELSKSIKDWQQEIRAGLKKDGVWHGEVQHIKKNGTVFWTQVNVTEFKHRLHGPVWIIIHRDITDRKHSAQMISESEERFRALFEAAPDAIFLAEPETGKILDANQTACRLLQRSLEEIIGIHHSRLHPQENHEYVTKVFTDHIQQATRQGYTMPAEGKIIRSDGIAVPVEISSQIIYIHGHGLLMGVFRNISERKQSENALRESEERYRALVEHQPDMICRWKTDATLTYVNQAYCNFFGKSCHELLNMSWIELLPPDSQKELHNYCTNLKNNPVACAYEHLAIDQNGEKRWLAWRDIPIFDASGQLIEFQSVGRDITEQKKADTALRDANKNLQERLEEIQSLQETLRYQATRDSLTGLFNRRYLHETLDRELVRAQREKYTLVMIMIDIDHFKDFNDTHGHQAGDEILRALGNLLQSCTRQGDIACRFGGEEFLLVFPHAGIQNARERADDIRRKFDEMRVVYNQVELHASISIGLAYSPQHGTSAAQLIKAADDALYKAKQAGRNCVYVWDEPVND